MRLFGLAAVLSAGLVLAGCGTFLPIADVSGVEAQQLQSMRTYRVGDLNSLPRIERSLGTVEGHSCKNKPWDPVSEDAALQQLKLQALKLGANGVVEIKYDWSGTELATNCWQSVTASGVAVIFAQQ